MKILFFFFLLFFITTTSYSQVTGKLTTATGQPIPFATVLLLQPADTIAVATTVSNDDGSFTISNNKQSSYVLQVSAVGYETWRSPVFDITAQANGDFGTITLVATTSQLKEVVLRAEKPLYQKLQGGMAVNVSNSILTKGSTALEVLERLPGVFIDHQRGSIMLNGKSGVTVMINGRLMHMSIDQLVALLNGMNGDDIARIELLTSPPAKYDADGSGGVINIVLKKNTKQGLTGSYTLTGGWGWREKTSAGVTLGDNKNRGNLYGSYTFSHNRTLSDMFINSDQNMPYMGGPLNVILWDTTHSTQNSHNAMLGIDVKLNAKTTIGANVTFSQSGSSTFNVNHSTYTILPDSVLQYDGMIRGNNRWANVMNSVYLDKELGKGEKLNIGVDYLFFKNNNPSVIQSSFFNSKGDSATTGNNLYAPMQRGFANTTIQVGVVQVDYSKQFSEAIKLESGIKGAYTHTNSFSGIERLVNGEWLSSGQTSNNIIMNESVQAAYASLNARLSKFINLTAGARYEYSSLTAHNPKNEAGNVTRKLGKFFPNIFFTKKINDNAALELSFTQRISRPSYNDLASYVGYSDPTAVYTGNPLLKPTITNNFKLQYNYGGYFVALAYSRDNNTIARYQITESPDKNLLYVSPQNVLYQNNYNLQANIPIKINNWWSMSYSPTAGWRQFEETYTVQPVKKTYFAYTFNYSQVVKLPSNFSVELSGNAWSPFYNGTTRINGGNLLNLGIKKLLKNSGTLQLSVTDLLMTAHFVSRYGTLTHDAFGITNFVDYKTETRRFPVIKLSFTKSFGGDANKSKSNNGSKEERERMPAQ